MSSASTSVCEELSPYPVFTLMPENSVSPHMFLVPFELLPALELRESESD